MQESVLSLFASVCSVSNSVYRELWIRLSWYSSILHLCNPWFKNLSGSFGGSFQRFGREEGRNQCASLLRTDCGIAIQS